MRARATFDAWPLKARLESKPLLPPNAYNQNAEQLVESVRENVILSSMAGMSERDINQPGGWLVEVRTLGGDPEYYKAYELDRTRAIERVRAFAFVVPTETCVAVKELHLHEFTGDKMMPGQVKRHWGKL